MTSAIFPPSPIISSSPRAATEPHLRAIVNEIIDRLREDHGLSPRAIDGDRNTPWQVMDYFDVIVHVMRTDVREKYDLEGLWGDAGKIAPRARPRCASRQEEGAGHRDAAGAREQGDEDGPGETPPSLD